MPHLFSPAQVQRIVGAPTADLDTCAQQRLLLLPHPGPLAMTGAWQPADVIGAHVGVQLLAATRTTPALAMNRATLLAERARGLLRDIASTFLAYRTFTLLLSARRVNILVEGELDRETPGYIKVSTRPAVEGMRAAIEQELAAVV